ncbi:MAG: response regulator transcription factor [Ardenticatenaceae bacterium]|nr:response regulator transcription factor [Ardenticatenaceae bacterium]
MRPIRVLVADDHVVMREGICLLLEAEPDIEVVGQASDGLEAYEKARELKPDVVLMDITMPRMSGLAATRQLRATLPETQVLVLTMHEGDEFFFRVLQAGASGYVLKGASSDELLSGIRAVYQGGVYLYPTMARKLMSDYLSRLSSEQEGYDELTSREREVLTLIAEGLTTREIAERLVISANTVQTHRQNVMDKLDLHNRSELIKYAIRKGLITVDEPGSE